MPTISTPKEPEEGDRAVAPGLSLGRLLHLAQKTSARALRAELERFGITPVQFAVLSELYQDDGLSLNVLAERMRADPPTICGVIDCLVAAGHVERRSDPCDRRRLRLFATPQARAIEGELAAADSCRIEKITSLMSPGERETLTGLLRRILAAAEGGGS